jgi:hypothetical protein
MVVFVDPVDHRTVLFPQLPVIPLAVNVELPGAQYVAGDAVGVKLRAVSAPGTTND